MPNAQIQGAACDLSTAEIQIAGRPLLYGFSSIGWDRSLTPEFVWWNGSPLPQDRTTGKSEPAASAEMPLRNHALLVQALGGSGEDGLQHMRTEFDVTILFRPASSSQIYKVTLQQVRITKESFKNEHGSKSTVSLDLQPLKIIGPLITA